MPRIFWHLKKSHTFQRYVHHSLLHPHNLARTFVVTWEDHGQRRKIGKLMKIDEICQRSLFFCVSKWWPQFQNNWLNFVSQVFFRKVSLAKVVSWVKLSMDLEQTNIANLRQNWCHPQCTTPKWKFPAASLLEYDWLGSKPKTHERFWIKAIPTIAWQVALPTDISFWRCQPSSGASLFSVSDQRLRRGWCQKSWSRIWGWNCWSKSNVKNLHLPQTRCLESTQPTEGIS